MLTKGMTTTVPWLEDVAARNGRPVMIAAMFTDPNDPERVVCEFGEIQTARRHGRELWGQVGCYPLGMEYTMSLPYPLHAMLAWRPAMEALGTDRYLQLFKDQSFRAAVKAEARTKGVPVRFSYHSFDQMRVHDTPNPKFRSLVGSLVADLASAAGKDPFDWVFDHALEGGMQTLFDCKLFNVDEEKVRDLLVHPCAALGLGDAGAHLSFLCDAGFGLHLLGHWVRERGDLTLEQAVQMVTSRLADAYRIADRGRLVPGAHAQGPWSPGMLHGRLLAGLAALAIERDHGVEGFVPVRLTVDMFRSPSMEPADERERDRAYVSHVPMISFFPRWISG